MRRELQLPLVEMRQEGDLELGKELNTIKTTLARIKSIFTRASSARPSKDALVGTGSHYTEFTARRQAGMKR